MAEPLSNDVLALLRAARTYKQLERRCRREARAIMEALDHLRPFFVRHGVNVQVSRNQEVTADGDDPQA